MFVFWRLTMRELEEAIRKDGIGLGTEVVKVDMFLNHRIDTALLMKMGEYFANEFREDKPTLVLTVEASGIAMAVAAAAHLDNIPVLFAKKSATVVQTEDMLQAPVYSFTHKTQNIIRINRNYIPEGSRVLIVDDFLANGEATQGMISLCRQAGAEVIGIGIAVEKGFQNGGKLLREQGYKLRSLAIIDAIEDGKFVFREQ